MAGARPGRGGRAAAATVELASDGTEVSLAVTDNGPGLPAAECQRLLQRWAQGAHGERLGEGAGLCLAIVPRYAALMHARFELVGGTLGLGLGARVVFPLPGQLPGESA